VALTSQRFLESSIYQYADGLRSRRTGERVKPTRTETHFLAITWAIDDPSIMSAIILGAHISARLDLMALANITLQGSKKGNTDVLAKNTIISYNWPSVLDQILNILSVAILLLRRNTRLGPLQVVGLWISQ
jgi:hypothetical protein